MRCGEHVEHTTRPHFLQWCFLVHRPKAVRQTGHSSTAASGCHGGTVALSAPSGIGDLFGVAMLDRI